MRFIIDLEKTTNLSKIVDIGLFFIVIASLNGVIRVIFTHSLLQSIFCFSIILCCAWGVSRRVLGFPSLQYSPSRLYLLLNQNSHQNDLVSPIHRQTSRPESLVSSITAISDVCSSAFCNGCEELSGNKASLASEEPCKNVDQFDSQACSSCVCYSSEGNIYWLNYKASRVTWFGLFLRFEMLRKQTGNDDACGNCNGTDYKQIKEIHPKFQCSLTLFLSPLNTDTNAYRSLCREIIWQ